MTPLSEVREPVADRAMTPEAVVAGARQRVGAKTPEGVPECRNGEHDRVFSDLYPGYAIHQPGTANPIRCYWICRRCGLHGCVLFRCNHRAFEALVEKFQCNPQSELEWSVVDYAEEWLAQRPRRGSPVSTCEFVLGTLADIRDDLDREVQRRIDAQIHRDVEESMELDRQAAATRQRCSVVYFIRNVDTGLIKIGVTLDLNRRLSDLRRGGGSDLEVLGTVPGDCELESELHHRWSGLRVRSEWFSPGQELLAWISDNAKRVGLVA